MPVLLTRQCIACGTNKLHTNRQILSLRYSANLAIFARHRNETLMGRHFRAQLALLPRTQLCRIYEELLAFFSRLSTIGSRPKQQIASFQLMARNLNLFFDANGAPRARGPSSEKLLMAFLEEDVQGSDHICHDLMDDITAIEDESAESREFIGNAHSVVMTAEGVTIEFVYDDDGTDESAEKPADSQTDTSKTASSDAKSGTSAIKTMPEEKTYKTGLKHFREVLEDWEAFILDDQSPA